MSPYGAASGFRKRISINETTRPRDAKNARKTAKRAFNENLLNLSERVDHIRSIEAAPARGVQTSTQKN